MDILLIFAILIFIIYFMSVDGYNKLPKFDRRGIRVIAGVLLGLIIYIFCFRDTSKLKIGKDGVEIETAKEGKSSGEASVVLAQKLSYTQPVSISKDGWVCLGENKELEIDVPINIEQGLCRDCVAWKEPITSIKGTSYSHGLGMHAPLKGEGLVKYKLDKHYDKFEAYIGLAMRENDDTQINSTGVIFRVYLDDKLFEYPINSYREFERISLDVSNVFVLKLGVEAIDGKYEGGHSVWANPRIHLRE